MLCLLLLVFVTLSSRHSQCSLFVLLMCTICSGLRSFNICRRCFCNWPSGRWVSTYIDLNLLLLLLLLLY